MNGPRRAPSRLPSVPAAPAAAALTLAALAAAGILLHDRKKPEQTPALRDASSVSAAMQGTRAQKLREEARVHELGLEEFETVADIERARVRGELARVKDGADYDLDPAMGSVVQKKYRRLYHALRPHTYEMMRELADTIEDRTGKEPKVTSLTRSRAYLRRLARTNRNVSMRSSHLTGAAFDISYAQFSAEERRWIAAHLAALEATGKIEAVMERGQRCFHVFDREATD